MELNKMLLWLLVMDAGYNIYICELLWFYFKIGACNLMLSICRKNTKT